MTVGHVSLRGIPFTIQCGPYVSTYRKKTQLLFTKIALPKGEFTESTRASLLFVLYFLQLWS